MPGKVIRLSEKQKFFSGKKWDPWKRSLVSFQAGRGWLGRREHKFRLYFPPCHLPIKENFGGPLSLCLFFVRRGLGMRHGLLAGLKLEEEGISRGGGISVGFLSKRGI